MKRSKFAQLIGASVAGGPAILAGACLRSPAPLAVARGAMSASAASPAPASSALSAAAPATRKDKDEGLNFIIVVCDSFRFDNLACYTTARRPRFRAPVGEVQTPHLDRFAERATVFERCYAASYPTVQNRKDLFTGKIVFPFEGWSPLSTDAVTFVKLLKDAGYWTQSFQDTPHTILKGFNFTRDFDGWQFIRGQETDNPGPRPLPQPGEANKTRGQANWSRHLGNIQALRRFEQDCFCAQTMTQAVQWLEHNYNLGRFVLYIDTFDPHEPWDAPTWYEERYDPGYTGESYRYPIYGRADVYSAAELAHMRALYAAETTLVDRWVGFLLESAERMGLFDNTCIIMVSDHGVATGDHGWTGKNAMPMYETIAHVPLLIRLPGQASSRRVAALVEHCDLLPTMLDLAGAKTPDALSGVSLRPALEGRPMPTRPYIFTRGNDGLRVTAEDWSLVYPVTNKDNRQTAPPELFQLASDPCETRNVLRGNLDQARRMWEAYNEWMTAMLGKDNADAPARP